MLFVTVIWQQNLLAKVMQKLCISIIVRICFFKWFKNRHNLYGGHYVLVSAGMEEFSSEYLGWCYVLLLGEKHYW